MEKNELAIWQTPEEVKKLFAPNLSQQEFEFFMGLGKSLQANPFTREIWAVKYGTAAASVFCGRDFYRKKAQEQPSYNGHYVESVYSNDQFEVVNGSVNHKFKLTDRGALLGAYCVVKVKGRELNYFNYVSLAEYNSNQSNWKTKPETMIKKVAESQSLRAAFQGIFAGTYDESEQHKIESPTGEFKEATIMISPAKIEEIRKLVSSDLFSEKERQPILNKVESFTSEQADRCFTWLNNEIKFREDQLRKEAEEAQAV